MFVDRPSILCRTVQFNNGNVTFGIDQGIDSVFRYPTSMHVLTCLLCTGQTSLGLFAVYEGDCIRFWFASDVGKKQCLKVCPILPQRREVHLYGSVLVCDEAGASIADLSYQRVTLAVESSTQSFFPYFVYFFCIFHFFDTLINRFSWCFVWLFVTRRTRFRYSAL